MSDTLLLLLLNGLIWGLIIALIALGLSIIFGLLDIINIAHGDFFMVGTVLSWFVLQMTGDFWIGFILVPLICFILGALIQRAVIQPIQGAAALSIVATFGLSLILQEAVRMTFGPTPQRILPPVPGTVRMFGIAYDVYRLYAAAFAVALAGFGGVVAAPITTVDFRGGVDLLPICFIAVVIGGLGNLPGTAAAAVLLAVFEGAIQSVASPTAARIASLVLMSVVLL